MIEVLSILSSLMLLMVYVLYFRQLRSGASKPNPVSWLTWAVASLINAMTYFTVVEGDYWKCAVAIIANVCMVFICAYSFSQGKFSKLNKLDYVVLLLTLVIGTIWQLTQDDRLANILIQIVFVVSFIPTVYGLYIGALKEKAFPWWLAVSAYAIQLLLLTLSFSGDWLELLFPFVNGVLGNGSVALLATVKKK